jgi:hypothetical protein
MDAPSPQEAGVRNSLGTTVPLVAGPQTRPLTGAAPLPTFIGHSTRREITAEEGGETMLLLILLALLIALFVGLGFVVKWLFIAAVVAALFWLIAFFTRGARA